MALIKGPSPKLPKIEGQFGLLLSQCMQKMSWFIEETLDEEAFDDLKPEFVHEIVALVKDFDKDSSKPNFDTFWKHFESQTVSQIKSIIL